jgi:hypothetical protein
LYRSVQSLFYCHFHALLNTATGIHKDACVRCVYSTKEGGT